MCDVATRTCALLFLHNVATLAVKEVEVIGDVTSLALTRHEFEGTTVQELPATHILLVQLLNDLSKMNKNIIILDQIQCGPNS